MAGPVAAKVMNGVGWGPLAAVVVNGVWRSVKTKPYSTPKHTSFIRYTISKFRSTAFTSKPHTKQDKFCSVAAAVRQV